MVYIPEGRLPRKVLAKIERKWPVKIGFTAHNMHDYSDRIRLTKHAQHRMLREGLMLQNYLDGQNREELAQCELRYVPVALQGKGKKTILIGAIVTLIQARTILKKNGFNPNKIDIHDLEGKAFLHRNGVWIVVDLEQPAQ